MSGFHVVTKLCTYHWRHGISVGPFKLIIKEQILSGICSRKAKRERGVSLLAYETKFAQIIPILHVKSSYSLFQVQNCESISNFFTLLLIKTPFKFKQLKPRMKQNKTIRAVSRGIVQSRQSIETKLLLLLIQNIWKCQTLISIQFKVILFFLFFLLLLSNSTQISKSFCCITASFKKA